MNRGTSENGSHFECILNKLGNGFLKAYAFDFFKRVISGLAVQIFSVACLDVVAFSTLVANHEWIFRGGGKL